MAKRNQIVTVGSVTFSMKVDFFTYNVGISYDLKDKLHQYPFNF